MMDWLMGPLRLEECRMGLLVGSLGCLRWMLAALMVRGLMGLRSVEVLLLA
jgi:hypothetical protein